MPAAYLRCEFIPEFSSPHTPPSWLTFNQHQELEILPSKCLLNQPLPDCLPSRRLSSAPGGFSGGSCLSAHLPSLPSSCPTLLHSPALPPGLAFSDAHPILSPCHRPAGNFQGLWITSVSCLTIWLPSIVVDLSSALVPFRALTCRQAKPPAIPTHCFHSSCGVLYTLCPQPGGPCPACLGLSPHPQVQAERLPSP